MTDGRRDVVPFGEIQGVAASNVPAYSNEHDDFISFESFYVHGVFTGFKWQCVEFARRWLLLRKSCVFSSIGCAFEIWQNIKYVERVTDGQQFLLQACSNGSPSKPQCDAFLIYPCTKNMPYGHIAVICDVQENSILVTEQNYSFHYWPSNYARQIPLIYENGLYYIKDKHDIYGWMIIVNSDELKPLDETNINYILKKYQLPKNVGELQKISVSTTSPNEYSWPSSVDNQTEKVFIQLKNMDFSHFKANDEFIANISYKSNETQKLLIHTLNYIIDNDDFLARFEIPDQLWSQIRKTWRDERDLDVLSYMCFEYDGRTWDFCRHRVNHTLAIFHSTVLKDKRVRMLGIDGQFTSGFQLHGLLVRRWKRLNITSTLHILVEYDEDDLHSILYMQSVVREAGIKYKLCLVPNDFYWKNSIIVDKDGDIVNFVWKLWNWTTIFQGFSNQCCDQKEKNECKSTKLDDHPCLNDILLSEHIKIIEPLWKSIIDHPLFFSVHKIMFPNQTNILENRRLSKRDFKEILLTNGSKTARPKTTNKLSGIRKCISVIDGLKINRNRQCNLMETIPEKTMANVENVIIISWIISGLCAGFSTHTNEDLKNNVKNPKTCYFMI